MSDIIIDTSVLIDMFVATRPRHSEAQKLGKHLIKQGIQVNLPMHALFELTSAFASEKSSIAPKKIQFTTAITEDMPLSIKLRPIDQAFLDEYLIGNMPHLKAGDLIFVLMAKVDDVTLITEDDEQYKKAQAIGVDVCRIKEFLARNDIGSS